MKRQLLFITIFLAISSFSFSQQRVSSSFDLNGFSGEVVLRVEYEYYMNPRIRTNPISGVITGYKNHQYDDILREAGITFPIQMGEKEFYTASATFVLYNTSNQIIESISGKLSIDGWPQYVEFSESTKKFLKNSGSDKSIVGKGLSGGEAYWKQNGRVKNVEVTGLYLSDLRFKIEKAIRDHEKKQKEAELAKAEKEKQAKLEAEKQKDAEEQAEKEKQAKLEAEKQKAAEDQAAKEQTAEEKSASSLNAEPESSAAVNAETSTTSPVESEAEKQARLAREKARQEELERQRRAQIKREYDERIQQQNERNTVAAGAAAASSAGLLYLLGGFIYKNMGQYDASLGFSGGNLYTGFDFGYGMSLTPVFFNSEIVTMNNNADYVTKKEVINWSPLLINLNLQFKFGYEHDYFGGFAFVKGSPGTSLVFQSFELSGYYGMRVFAGVENVKALFGFCNGGRKVMINPWINSEELGRGLTRIKLRNILLGLRFSWESSFGYERQHISVGVLWGGIKDRIDQDEELGYYHIRNIQEDKSNTSIRKKSTGIFFEWKHDHYGILSIKVYPKYPNTGYYNGSLNKDDFEEDSNYPYFQVSYTRSLDWFF